jgi:periplasmic protein TonB
MGQAASGNGAGGNGGALAGCFDPIWLHAVTERVRQFFYYPQDALSSRIFDVVMVHFVVHQNGQLSTLDIGKSSGAEVLDKAATDIMQKADPCRRFRIGCIPIGLMASCR